MDIERKSGNNMIGSLRHRVILKKPIITKDDIGQDVEEWQDAALVWASIEPLSGREYFNARQINSEVTTKIKIRYIKDLDSHWVIQLGQRSFNIISIYSFYALRR